MNSLFAQYGLVVGSSLVGGSVAYLVWTILQIVSFPKSQFDQGDSFEMKRLRQVRAASSVFRWFEPIVLELKHSYHPHSQRLSKLGRHLRLSDPGTPWTPSEFMATKTIEALLSSLAVFLLVAPTGFHLFAAMLALMLLFSYTTIAEQSVISKSQKKMKAIRLRMPFAIDQLALMLQAGAEFEAALETVVRDNVDHPLTVELAEVLRQVSLGRPRRQALSDLRNRLEDKDVSDLVFAVNKGEELGTPLSSILREQADQMRLKRSQWAEQAASEAEVQMVFPGMIVMVACLLVIIAPILLPVLMTFLE